MYEGYGELYTHLYGGYKLLYGSYRLCIGATGTYALGMGITIFPWATGSYALCMRVTESYTLLYGEYRERNTFVWCYRELHTFVWGLQVATYSFVGATLIVWVLHTVDWWQQGATHFSMVLLGATHFCITATDICMGRDGSARELHILYVGTRELHTFV